MKQKFKINVDFDFYHMTTGFYAFYDLNALNMNQLDQYYHLKQP